MANLFKDRFKAHESHYFENEERRVIGNLAEDLKARADKARTAGQAADAASTSQSSPERLSRVAAREQNRIASTGVCVCQCVCQCASAYVVLLLSAV